MSRRRRSRAGGRSADAAQTVRYGAGRLMPYLPPWAAWSTLPLVALLCRALAGAGIGAALAVGVAMAAGGAGLTAFTWHAYRARGRSVQIHATTFAGVCTAWVVLAAAAGLFHAPALAVGWRFWLAPVWLARSFSWPWAVWLLVGLVVCASWNIRRTARGDGTDDHNDDGTGGLLAKVRLAGRVRGSAVLEANDTRVRLPLTVTEGTADDVTRAAGDIAARLGMRRDGVRVAVDANNHANADVLLTPRDQLDAPIPWTGPRAPGESIAVELVTSRAEDGEDGRLWLPGDPATGRNATHLGVMGMTGAGKSEWALTLYGEALTRRDVSVVWSDHVKGLQTVADIAAGVALLLLDKPSATAGHRRLQAVIAARTDRLGKHGFKQWTPDAYRKAGLKFLVYHLEEGAALIANSEAFVAMTEQARSAGISIVLSQQRLSHDRVPTSARANLGAGACFGVQGPDDAGFILSEDTIDAGAAPWVWGNSRPGYHYLEAPGVPRDRWSMPHRGLYAEPGLLREVIAEYATDTGLDPTTAAAFGKVYSDYRVSVLAGNAPWQKMTGAAPVRIPVTIPAAIADKPPAPAPVVDQQPTPAAPRPPVDEVLEFGDPDDDVDDDQADDVDDDQVDDVDGDFEQPEQPEPGFLDDVDPRAELDDEDDGGAVPFGAPVPEPAAAAMGTTEARDALAAELRRLVDDGWETIEPRQLVELRQRIGRSPSWLTAELRRLVAAGELEQHPDRGVYALRAPAPV